MIAFLYLFQRVRGTPTRVQDLPGRSPERSPPASLRDHPACHSERSEESTSQPVMVPERRFFAALRMTGQGGSLKIDKALQMHGLHEFTGFLFRHREGVLFVERGQEGFDDAGVELLVGAAA